MNTCPICNSELSYKSYGERAEESYGECLNCELYSDISIHGAHKIEVGNVYVVGDYMDTELDGIYQRKIIDLAIEYAKAKRGVVE